MVFREMELILAVAQEKSITKAAKKLGVSQPSVSKSLINLEKNLGVKLFEKKSGEYLPTASGRLYCEYAEDILYRRKKFEKDFKDLISYQTGRLVYGITPGRSKTLTPEVVPRIKREFPDIHIELVEDNVENLEILHNADEFVSYSLKPQLKTLGPKYGKYLGKIKQYLENCNATEVVAKVRSGETIKFEADGQEIEIGKESGVFSAYFYPDEPFENNYESCSVNTIQIASEKSPRGT